MTESDVEVVDRPERGRYEVLVDGAHAGHADRRVHDGVMVLPHTYVDPTHRGRGLAELLVRRALADAREQGLRVDPVCWFVADHIRDHPEEQDLLVR
jgi:predicted GNAT family acetyltransferase